MIDNPDHKDNLFIRYLLNETSSAENEEIEDDLVLDPELANRLKTIEMLMIDRYVLDGYSAAERARFDRGFFLFQENRAKVDKARIFHQALAEIRKERESPKEPVTWFPGFLQSPSIAVPVYAVVALLVIGVVALVIFLSRRPPGPLVSAPPTVTPSPIENPRQPNDPVPVQDQPKTALNSTPVPLSPPVRPKSTQPETLKENNRVTGQPSGPGKPAETSEPQLLRFPSGESVTVSLELKETEVKDPKRKMRVEIWTEKLEPIAPSTRARVAPTVFGSPERFVLSISIRAQLLKENKIYYFAILNQPERGDKSLTAFRVLRTRPD